MSMLTMKALNGELQGQEFTITGPAHCLLGRSEVCQLCLRQDATVSRRHCLIDLEEDGAWVNDLGSLNGTFVNSEPIHRRDGTVGEVPTRPAVRWQLRNGDELRIGDTVFAVTLGADLAMEPTAVRPKACLAR